MKHKVYVSPGYRIPLLISCLGFVLCILCIFWTEDMNILVFSAYAVLSAGTIWFLKVWVDEQYRLGREIRFPLKLIFPAYPLVADFDQNTSQMSAFREAYADFMGSDRRPVSNSRLQNYATQLLWHSVDLQKRRMDRLGVQMDMEANRRSYVKGSKGVTADAYFDGRYEVEEVAEEIYALRTFRSRSRLLKRLYDKEVAHYTFLSAQEVGEDQFVCPNCGSLSSRSDLLDGCDFCKTTFTIEDLEHRVGSFGFRRDFQASEGKRKAMKKLIYPWIYMLTIVPWMYVGLFMPLYISDMNLFERIAGSLLCALTFVIGAFAVVTFALFLIFPLVMMFTKLWGGFNRWLLYRSPEEVEQERQMASYVRSFDPLFSLQSFLGGVQNKLYALYFADRTKQVNAFSDIDLASLLPRNQDVVALDVQTMRMESYKRNEDVQLATVSAEILVREFKDAKIKTHKEKVNMQLEKNADCLTQAVCGPSILRCQGCGSSLSLMDGKTCPYCGRELNLKEHDWVITAYTAE